MISSRAVKTWAVVATLGMAVACSKSPTSPSPVGGGGGGTSRTVAGVEVSGATSVVEGGTAQLTATARYSDQTTEAVTSQTTWTSSDPSVATVSATGLLTAVRTGSVDVSATFQNVSGRSTVRVAAARFAVRVDLGGFTATDTCDDVTQGLTSGEFATSVIAVLADGSSTTLSETTGYPGNPDNLRVHNLGRGETFTSVVERTFTLAGEAGQFVRIQFRATEWDQQIVVIPPSIRWVPDSSLNNRSITRTHGFANGTWSGLGPNTLTLGSGGCAIRLTYTVTATRQ